MAVCIQRRRKYGHYPCFHGYQQQQQEKLRIRAKLVIMLLVVQLPIIILVWAEHLMNAGLKGGVDNDHEQHKKVGQMRNAYDAILVQIKSCIDIIIR